MRRHQRVVEHLREEAKCPINVLPRRLRPASQQQPVEVCGLPFRKHNLPSQRTGHGAPDPREIAEDTSVEREFPHMPSIGQRPARLIGEGRTQKQIKREGPGEPVRRSIVLGGDVLQSSNVHRHGESIGPKGVDVDRPSESEFEFEFCNKLVPFFRMLFPLLDELPVPPLLVRVVLRQRSAQPAVRVGERSNGVRVVKIKLE